MVDDAEVQRVMDDTGMERVQAYRHIQARNTLREREAARFGTGVTDSRGRHHRCIPAEAILRGDWDAALMARHDPE